MTPGPLFGSKMANKLQIEEKLRFVHFRVIRS